MLKWVVCRVQARRPEGSTRMTSFFNQGLDAHHRGEARSSCPFAEDTGAWKEWLDGWDEGDALNEGNDLQEH